MRLSSKKLKKICKNNKLTLSQLLKDAGVSRNAYYSLISKDSVLPKSIIAITNHLHVKPSAVLEEGPSQKDKIQRILETVENILKRHKNVDRDNVYHTLILLEEKPIDRLRRALIRAQEFNIY
jgi:transcriptional regulator with XRE-family HTH domain